MDLKSVHDIFKDRILRIPSYQRGFSWSNNNPVNPDSKEPLKNIKGQLKDLWDDIININGGWHYTGLLTLVDSKEIDYKWLKTTHKQYAIVDGQQRITSILILLSVIIEKANELEHTLGIREGYIEDQYLFIEKGNTKAYIFGYDKDNPSDKYFRKHILKLDEIEDDSEESVYTENLKNARTFFIIMVNYYLKNSDKNRIDALQELFNTVSGNLRLNEYILPEELDEYVVFETMNNRGKPLSQLEKLKNRLMYLNEKFELDEQVSNYIEEEYNMLKVAQQNSLADAINKAWITIYKSLGKNKDKPLDDEDFVKNHWITFFDKYSRSEANVYANFLFDEYFTLHKVYSKELSIGQVQEYVKSLQKSSIWWNKLNNPQFFKPADYSINEAMKGIHMVGMKASFRPLLLAILTRDDRNSFIGAIKLLEKYSFKIFDISDRQSNTGDSKIYSLSNSIYRLDKNAENTIAEIELYISWYYKFALFINLTTEMFETGHRQGFYKWSGIKYYLFQYDLYLRTTNRTTTKASEINWDDFNGKDSIEHIYPQSAFQSLEEYAAGRKKTKEEVKPDYEKIQSDWESFRHYSPEHRRRFANSLGNLLAISSSDNASFSNDPFLYKVDQTNKGEQYRNRGYKYDSMSAMMVANKTEWTPETILTRGMDMLKYLCDYIDEDYAAIEEKIRYKVLGLEFMYEEEEKIEINEK